MELKEFLIERKYKLLDLEKRARKEAKVSITAQIQVIETVLNFLHTKQSEEDMDKLQLTLDTHATPVDDIKPRQETEALTEALIDLAGKLKPGMKFPLNNLPDNMKIKTITTKIYALRKAGKLPKEIVPITRTLRDDAKKKVGEQLFLVRRKG